LTGWIFARGTIEHLPGGWVYLLGEEEAGTVLQVVEEGEVFIAE
jgi:hypothetical protein